METINDKIVTLELKRIDLCDLLLACTAAEEIAKKNGSTGEKWNKLWLKVFDILYDFDEREGIKAPASSRLEE